MTLENLYKDRKGFIYKIYRYVGTYDIAEDLVQEAFTKALDKFPQYDRNKGALKSWFNSILFSVMWNYKRSLKRTPFTVDIVDYLDSEDFAYYEDTELRDILMEVDNKLHRKVLLSHLVLGYSLEETSSLTGVNVGNARKIVQRFRSGYNDSQLVQNS